MTSRTRWWALACVLCVAATATAQDGWVTAAPSGMAFEASFPGAPERTREEHRDANGVWVNHSFRATRSGMAYQVTVKDYARYDVSGVPIDQVLDATCRAVGATAPEPLPRATPARRCSVRTEGESADLRVYWSAPRLYVVMSTCRPSACDTTARDRFLRSFRLRPGA